MEAAIHPDELGQVQDHGQVGACGGGY